MFRKSILRLHLKDKLFFIVIAIFGIGALVFGVTTGFGYLSRSINGHENKLGEIETLVKEQKKEFGDNMGKVGDSADEAKAFFKYMRSLLLAILTPSGMVKLGLWRIAIIFAKKIIDRGFRKCFGA